VRFQIGHTTRVERLHIPMTRGVVGQGHGSERADFTLAGLRPSPDSGNTASMSYVWQRPKTRRLENIETDYAGFSIPNVFVIGYGMDYAERNRNLPGL
jgi:hypoxanthine phosphoribosyltransferase